MCQLLPVVFNDYLTLSSQLWLIFISPQGFWGLMSTLLSQELTSDVPGLRPFQHVAGVGRQCLSSSA